MAIRFDNKPGLVVYLTAGDPNAKATLNFQAGATTFGPVSIGPAPRVY